MRYPLRPAQRQIPKRKSPGEKPGAAKTHKGYVIDGFARLMDRLNGGQARSDGCQTHCRRRRFSGRALCQTPPGAILDQRHPCVAFDSEQEEIRLRCTATQRPHSGVSPLTRSTARKASCGISTRPTRFMRFLPAFCFSRSLRLREISPP